MNRLRELMKHLDVNEEKVACRLKETLLSAPVSEKDWKNVMAREIVKLKEEEGWRGDITVLANSITLIIGEILDPKYLHIPVINILRKYLPSFH